MVSTPKSAGIFMWRLDGFSMRALLVGAMDAGRISCTPGVMPNASFHACTCYEGAAAGSQSDAPPTASRVDRFARSARTIAAKPESSSSAEVRNKADTDTARIEAPIFPQPGDEADPLAGPADIIAVDTESGTKAQTAGKRARSQVAARMAAPASAQPDDDPVVKKAKATVAAKMEDPASAEFGKMNRAFRPNTLGKSVDTICGYVKASRGDTAERPFLYLVQEDEAYVVDGNRDMMAVAAYRNICIR